MASDQHIGRYRLIKRIAQGGMAEIFLAKQEGPGGFAKNVVIKRILPQFLERHQFVNMFLDEARLAALLSHPNIVQLFDFGEADGAFYLAMEYLAGEDLSFLLNMCNKRGIRMPAQVAGYIISAAADALHYAHTFVDDSGHKLNIVHRDVSPSNIFVTFQGVVKVLDFGIARAEGRIDQTRGGELKGKYKYMAPEQIRAEPIDARADVFALGALLYALLTGEEPFKRSTHMAVFQAILNEEIEPPRKKHPDVPDELEEVAMRALSKKRDDRFQSAQEMRLAIDQYLAGVTYIPQDLQLQGFLRELLGKEHIESRMSLPREAESTAPKRFTPEPTRVAPPSVVEAHSRQAVGGDADDSQSDLTQLPEKTQLLRAIPNGDAPTDSSSSVMRRYPEATQAARAGTSTRLTITKASKKGLYLNIAIGALAIVLAGLIIWVGRLVLTSSEGRKPTPATDPVVTVETPLPAHLPPVAEPPHSEAKKPVPEVTVAEPKTEAKVDTGPAVPPKPSVPRHPPKKPPAPKPEKVEPAKAPASGYGLLSINCVPWCSIFLDGKDTKLHSPQTDWKVKSGPHALKFVSPATGLTQNREINLAAGKSEKIVIRFSQ